jgi:uncharacterized protein DUF6527
MAVLLQFADNPTRFSFFCPGCKCGHFFQTAGPPTWTFDGNMEKPTVTPSILMHLGNNQVCHLIMTAGKIQFCGDCWHELKGQIVAMVDWDTILGGKMDSENVNTQAPAQESAPSKVTSIDSTKQVDAPGAAAESPAAPPPHPGFDRAVTHLMFGGFAEETAKSIVNHVGIDTVLEAREKSGNKPQAAELPKQDAPSAASSLLSSLAPSGAEPPAEQQANTSSKEVEKEAGPPEPGMKKCSACGIWYPGGYENCPSDNTRL